MTSVYRAHGMAGELLYVGVTEDVEARLGQHRRKAWTKWPPSMAFLTVDEYPTRGEALAVEAQAIKDERPRYNRSDKRQHWAEQAELRERLAAHLRAEYAARQT